VLHHQDDKSKNVTAIGCTDRTHAGAKTTNLRPESSPLVTADREPHEMPSADAANTVMAHWNSLESRRSGLDLSTQSWVRAAQPLLFASCDNSSMFRATTKTPSDSVSVRRRAHVAVGALIVMLLQVPPTQAQAPAGQQGPALNEALIEAAARTAQPADQFAILTYANRPIVQFRATAAWGTPAERAAAAVHVLDRLVDDAVSMPVTTRSIGDARIVSIGERAVFAILPQDVNVLEGETTDSKSADAAARLQTAFVEAIELRNPSRLLRAAFLALTATFVYVGLVWLLRRAHRAGATRLSHGAERQLERLPGGTIILGASHAPEYVRRASALISLLLFILLTDIWLTFVLRRFPYTRPWGESLRSAVLSNLLAAGSQFAAALPGLLTVLVVVLITRFLVRLTTRLFEAVEDGRVLIPGVYPETAAPTRRIVAALLWLFALVVSYGYLPGSDSDAFKGVSVFVGLMISLGSTGIMNQVMSGLTITYSRALRLGDFVKVGDVEGTVTHLGTLATKIRTPRREEITIPNAVVVSNATTNYSRHAQDEGVFVPTSLTIGYDTPWRQVRALLLLAAERTSGLRREPAPVVRQTALQDFYVQYTLMVCLEEPHLRGPVLDALHGNIQDAFNEYGVQIMSPNYEADPSGPKVVAKNQWYAAPAVVETPGGTAKVAT
jgi:small-conductance mechanosensitive channel